MDQYTHAILSYLIISYLILSYPILSYLIISIVITAKTCFRMTTGIHTRVLYRLKGDCIYIVYTTLYFTICRPKHGESPTCMRQQVEVIFDATRSRAGILRTAGDMWRLALLIPFASGNLRTFFNGFYRCQVTPPPGGILSKNNVQDVSIL